jgi:hypothetical protein
MVPKDNNNVNIVTENQRDGNKKSFILFITNLVLVYVCPTS